MPRRTVFFIAWLALFALLLGWNYVARPFENRGQDLAGTPATPEPSAVPLPNNSLTPEQSIALMIAAPLEVPANLNRTATGSAQTNYQSKLAWIKEKQPGFVTLFGSQISTASAQTAITAVRSSYPATLPVTIAVDHEGGSVQRLSGSGFTRLPSWQSLCAQSATQSAELLTASAQELKQVGVNMVWAPVVDIQSSTSPLRSRTCSNDPVIIIERATQFIQTFEKQQIHTSLKHFPGIGAARRDLHTAFDRVTVTPQDAGIYRRLLDAFPKTAVMISHVGVVNQYPDRPCSFSPDCITELKTNYKQALVVSDALEMESAQFQVVTQPDATSTTPPEMTLADRALAAARAGNEVLLFGDGVTAEELQAVVDLLVQTYKFDPAFKTQVDAAVVKLQQFKE